MGEYFFGYGSLVNRRTHDYPDARPAKLEGWRRNWRLTQHGPEVLLSARPVAGTSIDGLIALVPGRDWAALDLRETGYRRHRVSDRLAHALPVAPHVQVYAVPDDESSAQGGHILLSYLDVVVQGYLHHFGPSGAAAFFATTDGWDRTILNDRDDPKYPRHQRLSDDERAFVDSHLTRLPARISHGQK